MNSNTESERTIWHTLYFGYPGARGPRFHEYTADVRLLLPFIKGWKVLPRLSRRSVWSVSTNNEAVIGRWSDNETVRANFYYRKIFDSAAGVRSFLRGSTESVFWQRTLPVSVYFDRDKGVRELGFRARPISSLHLGLQP